MAESFFYNNVFEDKSVIAMSNEDSNFPKENLDEPIPSMVAKSTGTATAIVIDMGSATNVEGIAICNTSNLTTKNFEAHTADAWGTPDQSQAMTLVSRVINGTTYYLAYYETGGWSFRYFRLNLAVASGVVQLACPSLFTSNYDLVKTFGTPVYTMGKEKFFTFNPIPNGQEYRTRQWSRKHIGIDIRGMVAAQVTKLDDEIGEEAVLYFLFGSDLYYGKAEFNLPQVVPLSTTSYNINGAFTEMALG